MTNYNISFYPYDALVERLAYATKNHSKKIVFLLGAPVSSKRNNNPGIADVDGVVELIRSEFINNQKSLNLLIDELELSGSNSYQVAMNFLLARRGQDVVNNLIRCAVLGACHDHDSKIQEIKNSNNVDDLLETFENNLESWFIPDCLRYLAKLCENFPSTFGQIQLTTNFDPLLSLALKKSQIPSIRSILSKDGNLAQVQGDGCHIVHLHGFWRGGDTLHTTRQLNQPRPKLKSSISELLKNSIVVPVAYGGWDDIFTKTLLEIINDDISYPEILWTYYGDNEQNLISQNIEQLKTFSSGLDSGRLSLYKGVDCHELFRDLVVHLDIGDELANPLNSDMQSSPTDCIELAEVPLIRSKLAKGQNNHGDPIPTIDALIGRVNEINIVSNLNNKLIAIGGIGGQGKSSVAAFYANKSIKEDFFEFVQWRDCREQNDTLQTILIKTAFSLLSNDLSTEIINDLSIEQLCIKLAKFFENTNGLIIFDNVDHYVDLQNFDPLGLLKVLLEHLDPTRLKTKLIFTARPQIKFESENSASFMLTGLPDEDVRRLFEQKSSLTITESDFHLLRNETEGHPLWITLIALRCKHQNISIKSALEEIISGKGELPDRTILSIWNSINEKQKRVLRTLAELERPLPEKDVCNLDNSLNFNQFTKSLRSLKALGLVGLTGC